MSLANERTFLSWIRTSLGCLAVSVALSHWERATETATSPFAVIFAFLSVTFAAVGWRRWQLNERAMWTNRDLPGLNRTAPTFVALLVGLGVGLVLTR